jgi:hypothetical protein
MTQFAPGTIIAAELSKSVDAKKLKSGDPIEARTTVDMLSNGKIILPRNTRVVGHVTAAKPHSKDSPDSMISIAFDRLVTKDGHEMPLHAAVQAIGAPIRDFSGDPASPVGGLPGGPIGGGGGGGMGGGGGATSGGGGGRTSGGSSSASPSNYPSTGMPAGSTDANGHRSNGALGASSEGVIGMKDFTLSATPEASVVGSSSKNVHLDSGTQLILKTQQ